MSSSNQEETRDRQKQAKSDEGRIAQNAENQQEQEQEQEQQCSEDDDEGKVDKAVRFWTHPSLANTSSEHKIEYLKSRGISQEQLHRAWERIAAADLQQDDNQTRESRTHYPGPSQPPKQQSASWNNSSAPSPKSFPSKYPHTRGYASPNYYNSNYTDTADDAMYIPALLTVGGMLGLTAAAAVRWLNGGDFCLFPPPTRQTTKTSQTATRETARERDEMNPREQDHMNHHPSDEVHRSLVVEDNDEEDDDDFAEAHLNSASITTSLESLVQVLERHCGQQERILQQLANKQGKHETDQSMNLLRRQTNPPELLPIERMLIWTKLMEIHSELGRIQSEIMKKDESTQASAADTTKDALQETLAKLNKCMTDLLKPPSPTISASNGLQHDSLQGENESFILTKADDDPFFAATAVHRPATTTSSSSRPTSALHDAIQRLATENSDLKALRAGAQILYLYVVNLSSHPHVPRYRKIFTSNDSFQTVNQLVGGKDLLLAAGFVEKENCLEWEPNIDSTGSVSDEDLVPLKEAAAALSLLKSPTPPQAHQLEMTLSALRPRTPPASPRKELNAPTAVQTPTTGGFLISPPSTKKHARATTADSSSAFPPGEASLEEIMSQSRREKDRNESTAEESEVDLPTFSDALEETVEAEKSWLEGESAVLGGEEPPTVGKPADPAFAQHGVNSQNLQLEDDTVGRRAKEEFE